MDRLQLTPVARPRTPRRALIAAAALTAGLVLVLTACTSGGTPGVAGPTGPGSASASPSPEPTLAIARTVPFDQPATFSVTNGTLQSAVVKGHVHGTPLAGTVQSDGASWVSDELPTPSRQLRRVGAGARPRRAVAHAHRPDRRRDPAAKDRLGYTVTPFNGWTVGVNAPIVIRFDKPVQDKAAVEQRLTVATTTPLVGSLALGEHQPRCTSGRRPHGRRTRRCRWACSWQARRPARRSGAPRTRPSRFSVGAAHLTKVDGKEHTLTVVVNGKTWAVWPTSLGRPEFVTRTGSYTVLLKQPTRRMTSCNAGITCSKSNPNFYDLTVNWDVRLT